jgi:hypothetical protein
VSGSAAKRAARNPVGVVLILKLLCLSFFKIVLILKLFFGGNTVSDLVFFADPWETPFNH